MLKLSYNFASHLLRKAATLLGFMADDFPPSLNDRDCVLFVRKGSSEYCNTVRGWKEDVLNYPLSKKHDREKYNRRTDSCWITEVQYRKMTDDCRHERLIVFFHHPKTVPTKAVIYVERYYRPPPVAAAKSVDSETKEPIDAVTKKGETKQQRPKSLLKLSETSKSDSSSLYFDSRTPALDNVTIPSTNVITEQVHGVLEHRMVFDNADLAPTIAEFAVLLDIVNQHAINYSALKHQCFWFARSVWEGLKELWPAGVDRKCKEKEEWGHFLGATMPMDSTLTGEKIRNDYRSAWVEFEDQLKQKPTVVSAQSVFLFELMLELCRRS